MECSDSTGVQRKEKGNVEEQAVEGRMAFVAGVVDVAVGSGITDG